MRARVLAPLLLMLLMSLAGAASAASRATPTRTAPDPLGNRAPGMSWQQPDPDSPAHTSVTADAPVEPDSLGTWTRIAFSSYRDGNWEIYLTYGDGWQPTRLTNHPANDVEPILNRGATKIFFVSDRSGRDEIFVLNRDGSGLRQLTTGAGAKRSPDLSVTGQMLVYVVASATQTDIFVSNADGSQARALTQDAAADESPTWTPDGKIAWIRTEGGQARVWIMNADGSQRQPLTAVLPGLLDIVWLSSDNLFAVTYNIDSDPALEVAYFYRDRGYWYDYLDAENPLVDYRVSGRAPNEESLLVDRVEYVMQGNQRVLNHIYIQEMSTFTSLRLIASGMDRQGHWQTTDTEPPVVHTISRSGYTRAGGSFVPLAGFDTGGAGIRSYDLQYRLGANSVWTNLLSNGPVPWAEFIFVSPQTVFFRGRARDNAFNVQEWTTNPNGDTHTTAYQWEVMGNVLDTRSIPIANPVLNLTPPALGVDVGNNPGAYTAYISTTQVYTTWATQSGYQPAAPTPRLISHDTQLDFYLAPADNLIRNGDFELDAPALRDWIVRGAVSAQAQRDAVTTGSWGARVGQRWTVPDAERISRTAGYAYDPTLAFGPAGTLHLAWADQWDLNSGNRRIAYTTCAFDQPCQSPQALWPGFAPRLTIGSDAVVHLLWQTVDAQNEQVWRLFYAQRAAGGAWTPARELASADIYLSSALTVDRQGAPHVVWGGSAGLRYQRRQANGAWTAPESLGTGRAMPSLTVLADNTVLVASAYTAFNFWERSPAGVWSQRTLDFPYQPNRPDMLVDPQGNTHVVWCDQYRSAKYTVRNPQGALTTPIWMGASCESARLLRTRDGRLVAFAGESGYLNAIYQLASGAWSSPYSLEPMTWDGRMLESANLANSDRLAVVAPAYDPQAGARPNIFLTRFILQPEQTDVSSISQVVALPPAMHRPTLSLRYRIEGPYNNNEDLANLVLQLPDRTVELQRMTPDPDPRFRFAWFDLSQYAGQTVTVTLAVSSTADGRFTTAFADEVALGSWLTPLARSVEPSVLPMYQETPVIIHGANFIQTPTVNVGNIRVSNVQWLDANTLRMIVPARIGPGRYTISVFNPGGQEGQLPNALTIPGVSYLPLLFGSRDYRGLP
ncbi:MAG: IPT/TIG domain-containing protein [Anaerolineae bacterium]